ncbi:MAG: hypothetical protein GY820_38415 [Gammaproteobacteria bacterium]|nr:hypothetical protein [Gammaproteobacteria bacterium]
MASTESRTIVPGIYTDMVVGVDTKTPRLRMAVSDSLFEIKKGNVLGESYGLINGHNPDIDPAAEESIWGFGGIYSYLSADTELFLSSSSASDTNVVVTITGLTDDYAVKTDEITFTSGQAQQTAGDWFRITKMTILSGTAPIGDLYLAESDTVTAGVPDTISKVQDYMAAGINTTRRALYTVPVNHTLYFAHLYLGVRRAEDCEFTYLTRSNNQSGFVVHNTFPLYQNTSIQISDPFEPVEEKTDIEFRGFTLTDNTSATANLGFVLVDETI